MRRDVFHHYDFDQKAVYEAYLKVLTNAPFNKKPDQTPYTLLSFGIGMSFKFNMNGGAVNIHFSENNGGTDVQVRFSIVQLLGARYGAYDELMTKGVEAALSEAKLVEKHKEEDEDEYRIYIETPDHEIKPLDSNPKKEEHKSKPAFCTKCGRPLRPGDLFCGGCGNKVE